ncbi:MAG: GNAT family N-acetyltransferase [Actinomycetota bacterium]
MTVDTRPGTCALEPFTTDLGSEWAVLADRHAAHPFSRPEWVRAWADTIGAEPIVATVRRDQNLVAVYPLVAGTRTGLRSAADWHVPHLDIVGDLSAAAQLVSGVVASSRRVTFDFATGATAETARRGLTSAGYLVRERVRLSSPWIDLTPGWEVYRDALSSKKWRELRRRRRLLEANGAVTYTQHDGTEDLESLLTAGFSVEGSGWKDASGTAVRSDPHVETFYRRVAEWAATQGMLRLHFLRLDETPIAFDFAFVGSGAEWLLKTGFDPALFALSPGSLLRAEVLERAFASGLERYEFLGTADAWKREWTDRTRDVAVIDGYAPGVRGRVADLSSRLARRASVVRSGHPR